MGTNKISGSLYTQKSLTKSLINLASLTKSHEISRYQKVSKSTKKSQSLTKYHEVSQATQKTPSLMRLSNTRSFCLVVEERGAKKVWQVLEPSA